MSLFKPLTVKSSLKLPLVMGLVLAAFTLFIATQPALAAGPAEEAQDAGRILGNPKAPITVIEYASFTCPYCADFSTKIMPKFKSEWVDTGKAKWIYRDYAWDGAALKAAVIVRCAPPDRFYNFVAAFYANQANWARSSDPVAALTRLAKLGGVGEEKIKACLASKKLEEAVLNQQLDGKTRYGVNSTPSIFINGTISKGFTTWEGFEADLKAAAK